MLQRRNHLLLQSSIINAKKKKQVRRSYIFLSECERERDLFFWLCALIHINNMYVYVFQSLLIYLCSFLSPLHDILRVEGRVRREKRLSEAQTLATTYSRRKPIDAGGSFLPSLLKMSSLVFKLFRTETFLS